MNMVDVFKHVKGYFREEDIKPINVLDLDYIELGYENENDLLECLKPMDISKIYRTTSPIYPYMYIDFENFCHFELYDMSKIAIKTFAQPEKRIKAFSNEENYRHLYLMMQSNMLALDFIHNYKRISKDQLKDVFLYVYQSMDFNFDVFDDVIDDVFSLLKEENKNTSEKLIRVYRGQSGHNTPLEKAYSWTTSKKIAKFFANRFKTQGTIYRGYIRECDVVHRERDGEFEVLCKFEDVKDIQEIS